MRLSRQHTAAKHCANAGHESKRPHKHLTINGLQKAVFRMMKDGLLQYNRRPFSL